MPMATVREVSLPTELYDQDDFVMSALQVKHFTRGQAKSVFASEWDIPFPQVRM